MGMARKPRQSRALWHKGIGGVTQKERHGFSKEEQGLALYECKVAQFDIQRGLCLVCLTPITDPRNAIWACSRWMDGKSLVAWALGQRVEYNHEALAFDSYFRSPDEIRAEYGGGTRGHCLYHRSCIGKWRKIAPGMHSGGPAFIREFDNAQQAGNGPARSFEIANEVLRAQACTRMAEARKHKKKDRAKWLGDDEQQGDAGKPVRRRKKPWPKVYALGCSPKAQEWLDDAAREAAERPETDLERQSREIAAEFGVKPCA